MRFVHLKIATRLGFGFAIMLAMLLMMAGIGAWRLQTVGVLNQYMVSEVIAKQRLVAQWYGATNANGYRTLAWLRTTDPAQQADLEGKIKTVSAGISEIQKKLEALSQSADELDLLKEIGDKRAAYLAVREALSKQKSAGDIEGSNKLVDSTFQPALNAYLSTFNKLIAFEDDQVDKSSAQIELQYHQGQMLIAVIAGFGVLLGIMVSMLIGRSITVPLNHAIKIATTVATGDLTSHIEAKGDDELSHLLQALKTMNDSLVKIVNEVRFSADSIASASQQISSGNQTLSTRTGQQAGALENAAAATEELTSSAQQNGDNAQQANRLATSASEVASKGGMVVSQVVDTMGSINESSKKIVDIIGVIDGIAFQTNILALNAAVEAARAGEQGRGFAVVATEVRNLAQRSAAAAKEIKTLIGASVEKVDIGAKLVDQAGSTMDEIVASIGKVTDIMGEITNASREQFSGIAQIGADIHSMDKMTQENAGLVEKSVVAAGSLQEQALAMAHVVSVFKIKGADPVAPSATPIASVNYHPIYHPMSAKKNVVVAPPKKKRPIRSRGATALPTKNSNPGVTSNDDWEEF